LFLGREESVNFGGKVELEERKKANTEHP